MPTEERKQELIKGLFDAVVDMDEATAEKLSRSVLDEGIDAYDAVTQGLAAAMDKVGELFTNQVYHVPELLLCSDALYTGLEILRPHITVSERETKRKIIIGTVEGDIHDIGKNLVKIMFEAAGWDVHDLGNDVRLSRFVEEHKRIRADVVALSALMTTTMSSMAKAVEMLKAEDPGVAVMLGGAPVTRDIALSYGADGYADDAGKAVRGAMDMLSGLSSRVSFGTRH